MTKGQSSLIGDLADDEQAAKYFEKQMGFDPDLWIVLIEDREGKVFMDGPVRYWTLASTREVTSANSAKLSGRSRQRLSLTHRAAIALSPMPFSN